MFSFLMVIISRLGLNKGLKFSPDDRTENIRRTGEVQNYLLNQDLLLLFPLISPYKNLKEKKQEI